MTLILYGHRSYTGRHQCLRPAGSKARVETDGQTDTTDCFTFPANALGIDVCVCESENVRLQPTANVHYSRVPTLIRTLTLTFAMIEFGYT